MTDERAVESRRFGMTKEMLVRETYFAAGS
jgi:hypothetical protein